MDPSKNVTPFNPRGLQILLFASACILRIIIIIIIIIINWIEIYYITKYSDGLEFCSRT